MPVDNDLKEAVLKHADIVEVIKSFIPVTKKERIILLCVHFMMTQTLLYLYHQKNKSLDASSVVHQVLRYHS